MRKDQREEIERLVDKANKLSMFKYTWEKNSQGSTLFKGHCLISPILKPTAFIDWLDAYVQGLEQNFESFGLPLAEVTYGVRNVSSIPSIRDDVPMREVDSLQEAVNKAKAIFFNFYQGV